MSMSSKEHTQPTPRTPHTPTTPVTQRRWRRPVAKCSQVRGTPSRFRPRNMFLAVGRKRPKHLPCCLVVVCLLFARLVRSQLLLMVICSSLFFLCFVVCPPFASCRPRPCTARCPCRPWCPCRGGLFSCRRPRGTSPRTGCGCSATRRVRRRGCYLCG